MIELKEIICNIIKDKKGKITLPFFIFGLCGLTIEVIYRAVSGSMIQYGYEYQSFMGFTSILMIIVYGAGGTVLSIINEIPKYYSLKMIYQTIIGGFALILTEFIFGVLFNIVLRLDLWNYTRYAVLNQICLFNSILWFLATPLFIFICDYVGWCLYRENEEWHYTIFQNYVDLIKLR